MTDPARGPRPLRAVDDAIPDSAHTLLIATTGGHLDELARLSDRLFPASRRVTWVTHPDPQASSLLAGRDVLTVPYIPPRGYLPLARAVPLAFRHLRSTGADRVVSTGAGIALPYFLAARALGVSCHYVESAARGTGPSLTGRLSAVIPGVQAYTQYRRWADDRWVFRGSVFDDFEVHASPQRPISRVVVSVGTIRPYGFRRLLSRLASLLPEVVRSDVEILWQVGATDVSGLELPGVVRDFVPNAELRQAVAETDLVVCHAGVGSALTSFELGRRPVLLPRRARHGEHVDDHQTFIAEELGARGIAVVAEVDELTAAHLSAGASGLVRRSGHAVAIRLGAPGMLAS